MSNEPADRLHVEPPLPDRLHLTLGISVRCGNPQASMYDETVSYLVREEVPVPELNDVV